MSKNLLVLTIGVFLTYISGCNNSGSSGSSPKNKDEKIRPQGECERYCTGEVVMDKFYFGGEIRPIHNSNLLFSLARGTITIIDPEQKKEMWSRYIGSAFLKSIFIDPVGGVMAFDHMKSNSADEKEAFVLDLKTGKILAQMSAEKKSNLWAHGYPFGDHKKPNSNLFFNLGTQYGQDSGYNGRIDDDYAKFVVENGPFVFVMMNNKTTQIWDSRRRDKIEFECSDCDQQARKLGFHFSLDKEYIYFPKHVAATPSFLEFKTVSIKDLKVSEPVKIALPDSNSVDQVTLQFLNQGTHLGMNVKKGNRTEFVLIDFEKAALIHGFDYCLGDVILVKHTKDLENKVFQYYLKSTLQKIGEFQVKGIYSNSFFHYDSSLKMFSFYQEDDEKALSLVHNVVTDETKVTPLLRATYRGESTLHWGNVNEYDYMSSINGIIFPSHQQNAKNPLTLFDLKSMTFVGRTIFENLAAVDPVKNHILTLEFWKSPMITFNAKFIVRGRSLQTGQLKWEFELPIEQNDRDYSANIYQIDSDTGLFVYDNNLRTKTILFDMNTGAPIKNSILESLKDSKSLNFIVNDGKFHISTGTSLVLFMR